MGNAQIMPTGSTASMTARPRHVAIVASLTLSLSNFRLQLIEAMREAGHRVTAFAPEDEPETLRELERIGVDFIKVPMARTGLNPFADLRTLLSLWFHFRRIRPDIVLPYTMKPVIYGLLAARLAGIRKRFALITGLGYVFTDPNPGPAGALLRAVSVLLYRLALRRAKGVFIYNESDASELERHGMLNPRTKVTIVPGSGVDLVRFHWAAPPSGPPVFLLIARLLWSKGIAEYVEAARAARSKHPDIRVQLLGPLDPNPSAIPLSTVQSWAREGVIEYLGETRDVRPFLARCSVFILPSYREGISRSILEAMATGRAIITTDAPGCRETVIPGDNGFIVPTRDSAALAEAMEVFARDPALAQSMGRRSYEIVSERFDSHAVNKMLLKGMELA